MMTGNIIIFLVDIILAFVLGMLAYRKFGRPRLPEGWAHKDGKLVIPGLNVSVESFDNLTLPSGRKITAGEFEKYVKRIDAWHSRPYVRSDGKVEMPNGELVELADIIPSDLIIIPSDTVFLPEELPEVEGDRKQEDSPDPDKVTR